jgi:hypothetical protein
VTAGMHVTADNVIAGPSLSSLVGASVSAGALAFYSVSANPRIYWRIFCDFLRLMTERAEFTKRRHRDDPKEWCRRAEGSKMTDVENMTDRESYIIAQTLYEFIWLEQLKPTDERRRTDEQDAKAILHERFDNELAILVHSDEAAGRDPPDCERGRRR